MRLVSHHSVNIIVSGKRGTCLFLIIRNDDTIAHMPQGGGLCACAGWGWSGRFRGRRACAGSRCACAWLALSRGGRRVIVDWAVTATVEVREAEGT